MFLPGERSGILAVISKGHSHNKTHTTPPLTQTSSWESMELVSQVRLEWTIMSRDLVRTGTSEFYIRYNLFIDYP